MKTRDYTQLGILTLFILMIAVLSALGGCTSVQYVPDIKHDYNDVEQMVALQSSVTGLPQRPEMVVRDGLGCFDLDGVSTMLNYAKVAESNTDNLVKVVATYNKAANAHNKLLGIVKSEEDRGNYYAERYAESESNRINDRKADTLLIRIQGAVIAVLVGALLL